MSKNSQAEEYGNSDYGKSIVDPNLIIVYCYGMKLSLLLIFVLSTSGCSTLAKIGEIEGSGKVGEYLRAIESTRVVMGGKPSNRDVTAVVNRTMGETIALEESLDSTTTANVAQRVERFGYIIKNVEYNKK